MASGAEQGGARDLSGLRAAKLRALTRGRVGDDAAPGALPGGAGIVDVVHDSTPIIGKTEVDGFYVNCGWGTGGFKATPGSAHVFAHTLATTTPHPINAPFALDRFRTGRLIDEAAAAAVAH